jgi:predicted transposase YbfD/YdcC
MSTDNTQTWYIVKKKSNHCEIVPTARLTDSNSEIVEQWGPFGSMEEAIARRVGLIRAGKCQPQ